MRYFSNIFITCIAIFFLVLSCETICNRKNAPVALSLKYPVVLVHGIAVSDEEIINIWGRIPERLQENNIKVFFGNTKAWGSYESNAEILKATIDKILDETNSEKVNIIAHSKGGIDSRYLIWKYDYGDKVASLTTISTPHRGAEIADLIYSQEIISSQITRDALMILRELFGDFPDLINVDYELTTEEMKIFNEEIVMDKRVYYQSIYSVIENPFDDFIYFESYWYIKSVNGDNDGIVSEYSARWGDNIIKIEGGISHTEIVDIRRKEISGRNIPDIYIRIVNGLSERGF
jgi:triacylglycerol lipase